MLLFVVPSQQDLLLCHCPRQEIVILVKELAVRAGHDLEPRLTISSDLRTCARRKAPTGYDLKAGTRPFVLLPDLMRQDRLQRRGAANANNVPIQEMLTFPLHHRSYSICSASSYGTESETPSQSPRGQLESFAADIGSADTKPKSETPTVRCVALPERTTDESGAMDFDLPSSSPTSQSCSPTLAVNTVDATSPSPRTPRAGGSSLAGVAMLVRRISSVSPSRRSRSPVLQVEIPREASFFPAGSGASTIRPQSPLSFSASFPEPVHAFRKLPSLSNRRLFQRLQRRSTTGEFRRRPSKLIPALNWLRVPQVPQLSSSLSKSMSIAPSISTLSDSDVVSSVIGDESFGRMLATYQFPSFAKGLSSREGNGPTSPVVLVRRDSGSSPKVRPLAHASEFDFHSPEAE
eukprot:TRINITY_DN10134_c0_g1_i2.p1 TRINITY_DN10134_c0_g1~~TRINITY_DN10134_c0_g1_i2.p1  ORF type:complete len:406 (+),score=27.47 TRINITY_DN10134_c0_g1_i2:330-1547(+)